MIFGNGEILKEQINTIKPFYIFDIKDKKDEKEREKSTYSHLNENKHHYYVEGNRYSTFIEPATKFWNLDELYNFIKKLFKLDDTGFGKWFDYENEFVREYSLDHTFESIYDLGVYCVIRTSETDYQLILIDKFIINFACNEDVLNNVLDFYNWTEYFGKEWEEIKKNRLKISDESNHKYIISRFIDDDHEDYFIEADLNKNIIYNSDKNMAQKFDTVEMARKAFEFLKDNKQLVQVKDKSRAEFSIIDIITTEPIYYILTDKTVFSFEIDARL